MSQDSTHKIRFLCAEVIAIEGDSPEFTPAIEELRVAIREHLFSLQDRVAELAFLLAAESDSIHVNRVEVNLIDAGLRVFSERA